VHRARNLCAKPPERERERVKPVYWQALDDAINQCDAKQRLRALVDEARQTAASRRRPGAWPTISTRSSCTCVTQPDTAGGGGQRTCSSDHPAKRNGGPRWMGRFPAEDSCPTLVWAVLDLLITHQTNGIRFTELDRQRLNRAGYHEPDHAIPDEVTAA
jgi:hypothetical protein